MKMNWFLQSDSQKQYLNSGFFIDHDHWGTTWMWRPCTNGRSNCQEDAVTVQTDPLHNYQRQEKL